MIDQRETQKQTKQKTKKPEIKTEQNNRGQKL